MVHIVSSCPQTQLEGGLQQLLSDDSVATMEYAIRLVSTHNNNSKPERLSLIVVD